MTRFLVPAVLLATVSGLAFTLIVLVIAQSPYTHANLDPTGYDRTAVAHLGDSEPFAGLASLDYEIALTGDDDADGRTIFIVRGCASCHGLNAGGGTVGPELDTSDLSRSEFRAELRKGPKGMPPFADVLSDDERALLYAFLETVGDGN